MKLSNETLTVLKNFASLNPGIEFKKGKKISTVTPTKTVLANATLSDEFPEDFCIYDLNQFLSVHSLYKEPELKFETSDVIFQSGKSKIKYRKTAKSMIVSVPDKSLKLPSVEHTFELDIDTFNSIMKSASVLGSPNIAFESDGNSIVVTAFSAKDDSAHVNSIEIAQGNGSKFKCVFLTENLKLIPNTYTVEISRAGLARFETDNLEYFVAVESNSSSL